MFEVFQKLCLENNVTPSKVAKECGINPSTITHWKNGLYTPKRDKLQKLADYFGVPVDYIINGEPPVLNYNEEETEEYNKEMDRLIALLRNADTESLRTLTAYIEGYLAARRERS